MAAFAIRPEAGGEAFRPVPEPILKWSNPIAGSLYGDVFIWTSKGRPEVVGSFVEWYAPFKSREVEFHSLSTGTFVAEHNGLPPWAPARPGVELKPIPDAPTPAASPAQRLRQMRELSKDFTAQKRDVKGVDWDLRLLTQPIYRYEGTEGDLVDGALFVFVHATDPEVFLQVEARHVGGVVRWQYGLARFNSHASHRVKHQGREAWTAPSMPFSDVLNRQSPYYLFIIERSANF